MTRLEVKVLARIGGKRSGEGSECCGTAPRLRASSGAVGSSTCMIRMPLLLFSSQDGATSARRQTLLARRAKVRLTLRDGDQKLDGKRQPPSRAPWDQWCTWIWTGVRSCMPQRPWLRSCNLRSQRWPSSSDWCAICWGSLRPSESLQARCTEVLACVRRQRLGRRRGAETLDHWSYRDLRRSSARRCVGDAITGRAIQRGGGVLRLQPRDRGWTANVSLPHRRRPGVRFPDVAGIPGACCVVHGQTRITSITLLNHHHLPPPTTHRPSPPTLHGVIQLCRWLVS